MIIVINYQAVSEFSRGGVGGQWPIGDNLELSLYSSIIVPVLVISVTGSYKFYTK